MFLFFLFSSHLHPNIVNQISSLLSLAHHIQSSKQIKLHVRNQTLSMSHYIQATLDHLGYQMDPNAPVIL
jgi:hypothetical protein